MLRSELHECRCPHCRREDDSSAGNLAPTDGLEAEDLDRDLDRDLHRQMNLLMSRLDEQQRRWYAALESIRIGYGGDTLISLITGLDEKTIHKGRQELAGSLSDRPLDRVRLPGGGRPPIEKKSRRSLSSSKR